MKLDIKTLIIGIIIGVVIGLIIGNFIFKTGNFKQPEFNGQGEFQIDEKEQQETASFFESNHSSSEIEEYCREKRMSCLHYCREINPQNKLCENLDFPQGSPK